MQQADACRLHPPSHYWDSNRNKRFMVFHDADMQAIFSMGGKEWKDQRFEFFNTKVPYSNFFHIEKQILGLQT